MASVRVSTAAGDSLRKEPSGNSRHSSSSVSSGDSMNWSKFSFRGCVWNRLSLTVGTVGLHFPWRTQTVAIKV